MSRRIPLLFLAVLFTTFPLTAQDPPEQLGPLSIEELRPQNPLPGPSGGEPDFNLFTRAAAVSGVKPTTDYSGTNGNLLLDSYSGGVLLRAFAATPNVHVQLGTNTGASSFRVFDSAGIPRFVIADNGYAFFRRDYDGPAGLDVQNQNAGTASAASARYVRFYEGATLQAAIASTGSGSTGPNVAGGASAMQLWNYANAPMVFATNSTERMRIFADGNVTIGAPYNQGRFASFSVADGSRAIYARHDATIEANTSQNDYGIIADALDYTQPGVTNSGSIVGAHLHAWHSGAGTVANAFGGRFTVANASGQQQPGTITRAYGAHLYIVANGGTIGTGYGVYVEDVQANTGYGIYQNGANDSNYFAGNVGIRTAPTARALEVAGDAHFSGTVSGTNIKAHYQDVAEWVPATDPLEAGSVVIVAADATNVVTASFSAYDTRVAGVVSAQPGIILGEAGESKVMVATTGRVKVKVDATRAPIRAGDLLVTSDKLGVAMRSEPVTVGGVPMHRPGTLVGKALEPLASGTGEILVLLSLQ